MSMKPGASTRSVASIRRVADTVPGASIAAIRPSRTPTSARKRGVPDPSTTLAPRNTMSMAGPSEEGADQVDDRVVRVDHRDQRPLVEHRARVREAEPHPVADLDRRAFGQREETVLVVEFPGDVLGQLADLAVGVAQE